MSAQVIDSIAQRRAEVRAQAAAIADAPRPQRRFSVPPGTGLRPSPRQRSRARIKKPASPRVRVRVHVPRRVIAVGVLLVQVALLVLALTLPVFRVHTVDVSGERLLSGSAVLQAASVPHQSIFTVDPDAIRTRIEALPWVQQASVTTDLPSTVHIAVEERAPAVRLRRDGKDLYMADNGASMPAGAQLNAVWTATPALLDQRAGTLQPVNPALLHILGLITQRFPSVFHCNVVAYVWGTDGIFSIWSSTGWRATLGHVDTSDELAEIPAQMAALGDLRAQLDFAQPAFGYVRLDNPAGPAVGGAPGLPDEIRAAALPLPPQMPQTSSTAGATSGFASPLMPGSLRPTHDGHRPLPRPSQSAFLLSW